MVDRIGSDSNRTWLFFALLVAVSAVGSAAFACVTPFAAFAVAAAYGLSARMAMLTVTFVWLANQIIGFAALDYPWTMDTGLWGLAIGAAALLATAAACAATRLAGRNVAVGLAAAVVAAFAIYEAGLFLVSFALGGQETFAPAIIGQYALLTLAWAVGLVGTCQMLRYTGATAGHYAPPATR